MYSPLNYWILDFKYILLVVVVMSRLDYSNVCSMDSPNALFLDCNRFKTAARIVTQERLRDHDSMSRALIGLHWLPVDKRIEYKLLLYTY